MGREASCKPSLVACFLLRSTQLTLTLQPSSQSNMHTRSLGMMQGRLCPAGVHGGKPAQASQPVRCRAAAEGGRSDAAFVGPLIHPTASTQGQGLTRRLALGGALVLAGFPSSSQPCQAVQGLTAGRIPGVWWGGGGDS